MLAERSAALRISSRFANAGCSGSSCSMASSAWPRITPSRLLKSWATPPASRPTDSIFWLWRSCSSLLRRASSARFLSVRSSTMACRHGVPLKVVGVSDSQHVVGLPVLPLEAGFELIYEALGCKQGEGLLPVPRVIVEGSDVADLLDILSRVPAWLQDRVVGGEKPSLEVGHADAHRRGGEQRTELSLASSEGLLGLLWTR